MASRCSRLKGCLLLGALPRLAPAALQGVCRTAGVACPAASCALAAFVHVPAVPLCVAVLMGLGCMAQLYSVALACRSIPGDALCTSTAVALLLATAVDGIAREAFSIAAYGSAFLAAVSLVCDCVLATGGPHGAENPRHGGREAPAPRRVLLRELAQLRFDWQPLAGGAICALSFGFVWNQSLVNLDDAQAAASFAGRALGALLLLATFVLKGSRPASARFGSVLSVAAAAGVLVWSVNGGVLDSPALLAVANLSQVLFLGLLWIETLFTDKDAGLPAALPIAGVALFLAAFVLGGALSRVLAPSVTTVLIPVLLVIYLAALPLEAMHKLQTARGEGAAADAQNTHRANAVTPGGSPDETESIPGVCETQTSGQSKPNGAPAITYSEVSEGICRTLGTRYGLSPREKEVLPLVILGYTSTNIGARLFISPQTVKTHVHRIYAKMSIHTREELVELFTRCSAEDEVK